MIPISTDNDILEMISLLTDERMMHVYIEQDPNEELDDMHNNSTDVSGVETDEELDDSNGKHISFNEEFDLQVQIEEDIESIYGLEEILNSPYNSDGEEIDGALEFRPETDMDHIRFCVVNGSSLWPKTSSEPLLPPIIQRPPGRPKRQRRRDVDEVVSSHKKKCIQSYRSKASLEHMQREVDLFVDMYSPVQVFEFGSP
ncbi:unnamed protein product [Citrullus colocynthis]|uniref:Uncharacterized protein n=1 Tax=Citrullus colocynthis TaxID=252529 RepID=A0ABP0Y480_9ROSI